MIDETAFSDISPIFWDFVGTKAATSMMQFCCLDDGLLNKGRLYLFMQELASECGFWE